MSSEQQVEQLIEEFGADAVERAARPLLSDERVERIEGVLDSRLSSVGVVIENLHDPHNGAAAIRSVEACGLAGLSVVEEAEPFRAQSGVTIGCQKWIDLERYSTFPACADALHERGFAIYAAVPGAAISLDDIDVSRPVAIAIGNEHEGLTDAAIAACDGQFSIPMQGFTQSFNLSVSVALCVYNLAKRRREHLGRAGDLGERERARLRARWYALGVRGIDGIVRRFVSQQPRSPVSPETQAPEEP